MSEQRRSVSGAGRRADYLGVPLTHSTTEGTGEDGWLITYLDVITLLLVMFVVMLALSGGPSVQPGHGMPATAAPEQGNDNGVLEGSQQPVENRRVDLLGDQALATLAAAGLSDDIAVIPQEDGVRFRVSNDILFSSGEARLSAAGAERLRELVPLLADSDYRITVAGHTDNLPIRSSRFPSNWELSSARAGSVVRLFEQAGVARARMQATGFADTRPLFRNDTQQGRAGNRRVEVILEQAALP